jgi:hypothetical protein
MITATSFQLPVPSRNRKLQEAGSRKQEAESRKLV